MQPHKQNLKKLAGKRLVLFSAGRTQRRPRGRTKAHLCAVLLAIGAALNYLTSHQAAATAPSPVGPSAPPSNTPFPGVTRDLISFCSARPSLSIDLAPMLVHVKRNTSFNYKLYLFSSDQHVFQTGQIVPRDDFRIHSFPVKLKQLNEFVPLQAADDEQPVAVYQFEGNSFKRAPSASFDLRRFFSLVPLELRSKRMATAPSGGTRARPLLSGSAATSTAAHSRTAASGNYPNGGDLVSGHEPLPGDELSEMSMPARRARHSRQSSNANAHIEFDRDDQLAVMDDESMPHSKKLRELSKRHPQQGLPAQSEGQPLTATSDHLQPAADNKAMGQTSAHLPTESDRHRLHQTMVMPVGSFSSFHINLTYFARKDFGQTHGELVRARVDPQRFRVTRLEIIRPATGSGSGADGSVGGAMASPSLPSSSQSSYSSRREPDDTDYAFLSHRLLRDPNTRLTAISQIYEDWITRNFYTIVYVQRKLNVAEHDDDGEETEATSVGSARGERESEASENVDSANRKSSFAEVELVTDRLIFRGSSIVLLGAEQLNYHVKASAFITEKNGLHYYLEFLPNGKFYVGAIDWSSRPFKFIDSQRFPIKPAQTLFDNEELLLCPPSVCYSEQPIDELVSYGRLALSERLQQEALILARSSSAPATESMSIDFGGADRRSEESADLMLVNRHVSSNGSTFGLLGRLAASRGQGAQNNSSSSDSATSNSDSYQPTRRQAGPTGPNALTSEPISLDNLVLAIKMAANHLEVRLHLRDWTWSMERANKAEGGGKFHWHYERAKRNAIKVTPDTYGYALVGHEIGASYRVFNELYLISANQLITINYTLANETVTSVHPIADEFVGLSSSLLDPITGAFYDRYANHVYFFKGERYVGYDYASKQPLEDFLLAPADELGAMRAHRPLVSSLPVVGILGRQHYVDAVFHDLHEDIVYIIAGMKFYTFLASEFKDGAFKSATQAGGEPPMRCINEHLLAGCRFDAAYPNPCTISHTDQTLTNDRQNDRHKPAAKIVAGENGGREKESARGAFGDEQQMRLRSIAARNGAAGGPLLDFLLENTLIAQGATRAIEPFLNSATGGVPSSTSSSQERIVVYLLIAMVLITVLITVAMIVVIVHWAKSRAQPSASAPGRSQDGDSSQEAEIGNSANEAATTHVLKERVAYPPALSQYLSNQYQHHRQHQRAAPGYYGQQAVSGRRPGQQQAPPAPAIRGRPPMARAPFGAAAGRQHYMTTGGLAKPDRETAAAPLVDSSAL